MKLKIILIVAGVLIFFSMGVTIQVLSRKYQAEKADKERISHNYKVVQDSVRLIKGENNLYASRIEAQELTNTELKTYYQNLVADVSDMKIQLRKVVGITAFNTETTNNIHTFFKDSTRINSVPLETLSYSDRWFDIDIKKEGSEALIRAASRDSLVQVVHWDYSGKFWPTKFLTEKQFWQDIKSMNPNSKITYSQWIKPIKNKRR